MHCFRAFGLLVLLLCLTSLSFAQTGFVSPEEIDIYTFDPSAKLKDAPTSYMAIGYEAYTKADYETAAKYYLAHLQTNPTDSGSWYNLSCCYGLLGKADLAAKYLQVAYKNGFRDLEHISRDSDFDKVKAETKFVEAMDSLQTWAAKLAVYQGTMEYFPSEHFLPYWIHLPKNFDPAKTYPLMIGLHGYGDKAYAFTRLWRHIENEEVIFVTPEAPYPFVEGEDAAFSWGPFVPMDTKVFDQAFSMLDEYITDLRDYLHGKYKIDQTWLMGFSQGAFNGYILALKNPDAFDGIIACGGGLITDVLTAKDYKKARNLKIIISHGTSDKVVGYEEATKAYETLEKAGIKNLYLDQFEGAHSVSPSAFKKFLEWKK